MSRYYTPESLSTMSVECLKIESEIANKLMDDAIAKMDPTQDADIVLLSVFFKHNTEKKELTPEEEDIFRWFTLCAEFREIIKNRS